MNDTESTQLSRLVHVRMVVVGLVMALAFIAVPGRAMADPSDDAGAAFALVNQSRAANGLAGLTPDRELQVLANRQANRMADRGSLSHTAGLGDQLSWGWWGWAENVGYGPSVGWVHGGFMNSGPHSANILEPSYNYLGVGVAYGGDGRMYIAEVFGAW